MQEAAMSNVVSKQVWWGTPILVVEPERAADLNAGLSRIILEKERDILAGKMPKAVAGVEDGLTAYWLTYNVLNWNYPECRTLQATILRGYDEFLGLIGKRGDEEYAITGISC